MNTPAGWYPDPQQQGQLRYWDGAAWTEHLAPAQQPVQDVTTQPGAHDGAPRSSGYGAAPPPGSAEQTSAYGFDAQGYGAGTEAGHGQASGPADPLSYGTAGVSYGSTGGYGAAGYDPAGPGPGGKPNRTPLIVGAVVGAAVVVALVVLAVNLIGGGGSDDDPTGADPSTVETSDAPTDDPTTDAPTTDAPTTDAPTGNAAAGEIALGETATIDLAASQTAALTVTITQMQLVRVYTASASTSDPMLVVLGPNGESVADDDDNGYQSDNPFDSSAILAMAPGEYTILVSDYAGIAGTVDLTAEVAGDVAQVELGDTEVSTEGGSSYVASIEVEPGTYGINVTSQADPILTVTLPDGSIAENDDRDSDAPDSENWTDPYVEVQVDQAGTLVIETRDFWGEALEGTLTITER